MNRTTRKIVVAVTLGLAALTTWAVTDFKVPTLEVAQAQSSRA